MMMKNNYEKRVKETDMGRKKEVGRMDAANIMKRRKKTEKRSELSQSREMNHISISLSLSSLMALIFKCYIIKNQ